MKFNVIIKECKKIECTIVVIKSIERDDIVGLNWLQGLKWGEDEIEGWLCSDEPTMTEYRDIMKTVPGAPEIWAVKQAVQRRLIASINDWNA